MKRALLALLPLLAALPSARAQNVISCPGVSGFGGTVCDGFTLSGGGSVSNNVFTSFADEHGLNLYHADAPFSLRAAVFSNWPNTVDTEVAVMGFRWGDIGPFFQPPISGGWRGDYFTTFHISPFPGGSTLMTFTGWDDLAVVWFDGGGGYDPRDPTRFRDAFAYNISGIEVVTPTPEPGTLVLVAGGLAGVFGAARRKRSASSAS